MSLKSLKLQDYRRNLPWSEDKALLPYKGNEGQEIHFGYESEFSAQELVPWFSKYIPAASFEVTNWKSLRVAERVAWVRDTLAKMNHGNKKPVLEKINQENPALPEFLHRDDTGNLELISKPYQTLAEFKRATDIIEGIAVGSLQAMISMPKECFFGGYRSAEQSALEHLGWLNFFNELDILERLVKGALRFKQKPQHEPVRTFLHPYLGPMISIRHRLLKKFLLENAKGNMLDEEELIRPALRDHSFKFVGSTAYRPDVAAPERICFEVRDAHKDPDLLQNRMGRILFYWQRDLSLFSQFSELAPFDSAVAYENFTPETKAWLEKVTPFKAPPEVIPFEKAKFTYEVYRNFAYPLRDWQPWLKALGAEDEARTIRDAQSAYIKKLEFISRRQSSGTREAQGALAEFALESGLFTIFQRAEESFVRRLHG